MQRRPIIDRFNEKIEKTDTCWLWTAGKSIGGYGVFTIEAGDQRYAHRVSYELFVGPIPDGLFIDHLCRVRSCVNPAHLDVVTKAENTRRGLAPTIAGRKSRERAELITHCPLGHPYDEANTYVYTHHIHGWTMRFCRTCGREKARVQRERKRAASGV